MLRTALNLNRFLFEFSIKWLVAFLLVVCSYQLVLADPQISVTLNKKQITLDDTVVLTIALKGLGVERATISQPFPNNFTVVEKFDKPSLGQDASGHPVSNRIIRYELKPNSVGKFTLGSFTSTINGTSYQSKGEVLEVKGNTPVKEKPAKVVPDQTEKAPTIDFSSIPVDVRLTAEVTSKKPYVGEPIILSVKVTSTTSVDQIKPVEIPSFVDFWNKEVSLSKQSSDYKEFTLNGLAYATQTIHRFTLLPTTSGKLVIPSLSYSMVAGANIKKNKSLTLKTAPISLDVIPLPNEGKPKEFSGIVGKSGLTVNLKEPSTTVGVPAKLLIQIENEGNPETITPPALPNTDNANLKLYAPKPIKEEKDKKTSNLASWEAEVIASEAGNFTIPSFKLAFFDPATAKYEVVESKPITLSVSPATSISISQKPNPSTKSSNFALSSIIFYSMLLLGFATVIFGMLKFKHLLFVQTANTSSSVTNKVQSEEPVKTINDEMKFAPKPTNPVTIPVSPVVTAVAQPLAEKPSSKTSSAQPLSKSNKEAPQNLGAEALRLINIAYGKLHRGNEQAYANEVLKALRLVFDKGFGVPSSDLNLERIKQTLDKQKADISLTHSILELYKECETICFSPTEDEHVPNSEKDFARFTKVKTLVEALLKLINLNNK